jgi:hypothetical protein
MFDEHADSRQELQPLEVKILKFIKSNSQTEKRISRALEVDPFVLYTAITDLIFKDYVEIRRTRKMYFFTQERCTITPNGLLALESVKSPLQAFVEIVQKKAFETIDNLAAESPTLKIVVSSARTLYKFAKVVV